MKLELEYDEKFIEYLSFKTILPGDISPALPRFEVCLGSRSQRDQFNRGIGIHVAFGRSMTSFEEAFELAKIALKEKVDAALIRSNNLPPGAKPALASNSSDDLMALLGL